MHVDFTPEQKRFRDELREYFARVVTPKTIEEIRSGGEGGGPLYTEALRQMGRDRLLGIGWPVEYGGQGRSPIEQFIFADEVQRAEFLPRILRGEMHVAIGYSEPDAGTDLASLKTRAVRDGDGWVINGQKMWTSLADYADYIWLAARTDPDAPKHRGISIFLVPTSAPGFSLSPITTVGGVRTNATFYENVRVPHENLIGGENNGWSLIVGQLNHERVSLMNVGPLRRMLEEVSEWARETRLRDGRRVIDEPWVRSNLARVYAKLEVLRLMNWKQAWALTQGNLHPADASAVKVFGSEFYIEGYRALLEVLGARAGLVDGAPGAVLRGRVDAMYRNSLILTFGGGTNEVQRDIIAMAGLQMPHYKH
jgi:alkylation response protein AidB-like acyl-CoA dehydrogenase